MAETTEETPRERRWRERYTDIRAQYPSVDAISFAQAFSEDPDLLARFVKDILKLDSSNPGKSGPRFDPEYEPGLARIRQLQGTDYSTDAFPTAFTNLTAGKSRTQVARRVSMSRTQVHRLVHGEVAPSAADMETIARAFGKEPCYFVEYRTAYIIATLADRLADAPEATIGFYRQLSK